MSSNRYYLHLFLAADTSDDRGGYGYSPGPGTPAYRTDSDPAAAQEYTQIQPSPLHAASNGGVGDNTATEHQGPATGGGIPTGGNPQPPGSPGGNPPQTPGAGSEGGPKPISQGWSTALAAAGVAATMSAAAQKRRTNPRNQRNQNLNPRPPRALFCLSLKNPFRKLCISIVEWKYPL